MEPSKKYNDTTSKEIYCKSCFEAIHLSPIRRAIEKNPLLCDKCISKIEKKLVIRKFEGIPILFLSNYSGIMETWLMNFKEYKDVELAPCFLSIFLPFIRLLFPFHTFVPLPSSKERIEKRGFDHLSMILQASKLPFLSCLEKRSSGEQKNKTFIERRKEKGISLLPNASQLQGKRVVLFDDVLTTGSTFLESLKQIQKIEVKSIHGLILMDHHEGQDFQIK